MGPRLREIVYIRNAHSPAQLCPLQYSVLVLLIVILAIVGTVLTLNGSIEVLKEPFLDSLEEYDPEGTSSADQDIVRAWDSVQQDVSDQENSSLAAQMHLISSKI